MDSDFYLAELHPNPQFAAIQRKAAKISTYPEILPSLTRRCRRWANRRITGAVMPRARRHDHIANCLAIMHIMLKFIHKRDGLVQVSIKRLAVKTGLSERTINRCMLSLDQAGVMHTVRRPVKIKGRFCNSMYAAIRKISRNFLKAIAAELTYDKLADIPMGKADTARGWLSIDGDSRRRRRERAWKPHSVKTWRN